jgi:hypothetical protein
MTRLGKNRRKKRKGTKDKEEAARQLQIEVEAEKESGMMTNWALLDTLNGIEAVDETAMKIGETRR